MIVAARSGSMFKGTVLYSGIKLVYFLVDLTSVIQM